MPDRNLPDLPYDHPTEKIKTLDVPPIHSDITEGLKKYQDAARGIFTDKRFHLLNLL